MAKKAPQSVDEYIKSFPEDIQKILRRVQQAIKKAAPKGEETIKYGMPSIIYLGNLVHFAAFKKHIGLFAVPTGEEEFKSDFSEYKYANGSIQFPYDKPLPLKLIAKIVKYRVKENTERSKKIKGKK